MSPPDPAARRTRLWLVAIVTAALVLRVVFVLSMRQSPGFADPQMDALYHLEWARAFAAGDSYQPGPFFRAPLYPWFLGVLLKLTGGDLLAVRLVQCGLGAVTTVLAYLVGRRAFDARVGLTAALLVGANWVLVYFDGELLIPTLIVPLDLLALWLTLGLAHQPRAGRAFGAGLAWGVSCIARPNPLLFVPFLCVWLLLRARPRWGRGVAPAAALIAGVLLPILPLTAYNASQGDRVLVASQAGVNLWIGNNPASDGSSAIVPGTRGDWWGGYRDAIAQAEAAEGRQLRPSEVSRHYAGRAASWAASRPLDALRHGLWKLRLFWTDWELGNNQDVRFFAWRYGGPVRYLPLGFGLVGGFGLLAGLALVGLVLGGRAPMRQPGPGGGSPRWARFPLWGFLAVYTLGVVAFFVCSRFRAPVLPVLAIYAAVALVHLTDAVRERRATPFAALVPAVLLAALSMRVPAAVETSDANGLLQLSVLAQRAGQPEEALQHAHAALAEDPDNRFALRQLGALLLGAGRPREALEPLRETARRWPEDVDNQLALAEALGAIGQHDEAERVAQNAVTRAPHLSATRYQHGLALAALNRWDEAADAFERALELDTESFQAAFSLGRARFELGDSSGALEALARAVELGAQADPVFLRAAYEGLIALLRAEGREQEAQALAAELAARGL